MSPKIFGESFLFEELSVSWVDISDKGEFCEFFVSGLLKTVSDWVCLGLVVSNNGNYSLELKIGEVKYSLIY